MNKDNVKIGKFNDKHIAQMVELCKELVPGECSISNFEANYNKIKDKETNFTASLSLLGNTIATSYRNIDIFEQKVANAIKNANEPNS